ncbi:uncharacterized protein LOC108627481 [Ceratina calcarata]|uniref:Uncharacterized protein LOC108627481 n=1 Tax=Ceratina calcarata TaxID=156304 RepID=A0AAJ7N9I0_9HYME|nr:uncharacterized protein LOC108627481 [Ceratina calcarata]
MGIDGIRVGGARCPPLLGIVLFCTCIVVTFNWWTLANENFELCKQNDDLNEQLKNSAEERDQCVTLRSNVEQRYKHAEEEVASLHVKLEQQNELKRKNDELDDNLNICRSELDSLNKLDATKTATLETLRLEKDNFNTQLDVKRDENKKLQQEIEQLKDELDKAKLSCSPTPLKKIDTISQPTRPIINKSQLGPVPVSAVKISLAGQRGLKYHGIPILPKDPPGAVRLSPRYSVSMLKGSDAFLLLQGKRRLSQN